MAEHSTAFPSNYRPIRRLGAGGQGVVFLAEGPHGTVVLKVGKGLAREAQALERVKHPALPTLLERGPEDRWLAFPAFDGEPYEKWMLGRPLSERLLALQAIFDAVLALHAAGVVHGDLKPAQVLVDPQGNVQLIDLGSATLDGQGPSGFRGSWGFAAPEVLRGETPEAATDVYGLMGLVYVALTGRPPFESSDPAALAYIGQVTLPEPPSIAPEGLAEKVLQGLARSPSRRPNLTKEWVGAFFAAASKPLALGLFGLSIERDRLRRAIVGACDGESRVLALYGPPGIGRTALLREAMACAEREGLHTGPFSMEPGIATVVNEPDLATRQEIKKRLELSIPGVIFVRTLAPLSDLGRRAEAMTLPPLSAAAVYEWAQAAGLPPERADQLWEYSGGQPHLIADKLHATPDPLESHLSKTAVDPLELAKKLKLPPLELLDRLRPGLAAHRLRITSQGWLEKA